MFRSDKKQNDKQAANEMSSNQVATQTWLQSAPPVEKPAPQPPAATTAAPVQQPPAQPRAFSEKDAMARDIKDGVLNGFVGNGTVMSGEAVFKGMLRVDGNLTGRVSSEDGTLLVGTNGQVDANVKVAVATIHGTVNGDIIASKRIELGRSAKVVGNIQTPALVIEQGAVFEGSCRMLPQGKGKAKATTPSLIAPTTELSELPDVSDIAS
ncbi:MAG: polymer-forming cytoskeletal protein [Acidobacteria bacterium]|nr:polymer-forming cytoskeletal protein [Acidobacteriota bacterium]